MMLYKKLLAILMVATSASAALANTADEYAHCTFNYNDDDPRTFNFSKLANAQEVNSDFGSTTLYELDPDGHIIMARYAPCAPSDDDCRIKNPRWAFFKNADGTWTILGRDMYITNAICTSSATNPHNKMPW
jgi:hypothetical protein